jgi:hypothetical protein
MLKRIALIAAVLTCCSAGWSKIGETEAQIKARYGESIGDIPTASFGLVRGFAVPGYVVGVKLVNGGSAMEMISKNDQSQMTDDEIEMLLKQHGADVPWKADRFDKTDRKRWRSDDGKLVAVYDTRRHFLYVNSKQFYDDQGKRIGKEEQQSR